jgi:O-antigen/teichoic acid export membrane protein
LQKPKHPLNDYIQAMKGRLLQNLSVNAVQLIVNQLLGLGIFYVLSTGLDKNTFGQINLALAILMAVFNILSCGIDQLVIKKIAAGADIHAVVSLYIVHVLFAGLVFYGLLFCGYLLFANYNLVYTLVLLIGIGKLMLFFSSPFKQAANGMERFRMLAYMLVASNLLRCVGVIILALMHHLTLHYIIMVFIAGDMAELLFCIFLFSSSTKIPLNIKWSKTNYFQLLREALPQTGVVFITSALARFDWIFIGVLVSAVKLAEYSFAYKLYEISTLPLLAIAPLLIPRFTKLFQQIDIPTDELKLLARVEMIIAAFTVLALNICWAPVIDSLTAGKYGAVNVKTIFILSLCLPLLYLNNFFWTIYFAQGRLKMILTSFVITFSVNVAGDIILIPFFKNEGAAFAFLASGIVQTIYYLKQNRINELKNIWQPLVLCTLCALSGGFMAKMLFQNSWIVAISAVVLYGSLLFVTNQLNSFNRDGLKHLLN